jgi:zinc/manganese transport system substrate-binding protein
MRTARSISAVSIAVVALALVASGCGDDSSSSSDGGEVTAVATTTQVADFVREVGGDRVQVEQILQPNSDPHGYEPRPSDVAALASADAIFQSGGELDEWLGDVIESSGNEAPTVELIQTVDRIEGGPHEHADGGEHAEEDAHHGENADPHWWQDPHNAIAAVAAIRAALIAADPDGRADYEANARSYTERLRRLDRDVAACIDEIPPAQRKLVTTHDALAYYADRYGIEVVGALIPSQSTAAQPSAGDTQELVHQIERENVNAIFPESSINPKLERAVSRETGAAVGRPLWSDTLGPADSDGATYVKSIQSNTAALVDGLTGGAKQCRPKA